MASQTNKDFSGLVFRSKNIAERVSLIEDRIWSIGSILGVYTYSVPNPEKEEVPEKDRLNVSISDATLSTIDTLTKIEQSLADIETFLNDEET